MKVQPYHVFDKRYRKMAQKHREKKAAMDASNGGKCWWMFQWMKGNPNRIIEKKYWVIPE